MILFLQLPDLTICFFFFFNDTATTEIYTLSLHDALPIYTEAVSVRLGDGKGTFRSAPGSPYGTFPCRSEEHTSELQSHSDLVCRLLLEKKKKHNVHDEWPNTHRKHVMTLVDDNSHVVVTL